MERSFTDIQYNQFLDGPAGVDLETGVLYLNPMLYSQLSDVGRKVVLLHELGHLNVGDNEFAADNFAYWKGLGLGYEALEQFKAFIGALKPKSPEQLQRTEAMLKKVIQNELQTGTDAAPLYNWLLATDTTNNFFGDKLQSVRDFVAKTVGTSYTAIYDTVQSVKQNKQYQQQIEQQKQDAFRQISETEQKAFEELAKKEKEAKEAILQQKKQQQRYIIGGIILVVVVVAIVFTLKK